MSNLRAWLLLKAAGVQYAGLQLLEAADVILLSTIIMRTGRYEACFATTAMLVLVVSRIIQTHFVGLLST